MECSQGVLVELHFHLTSNCCTKLYSSVLDICLKVENECDSFLGALHFIPLTCSVAVSKSYVITSWNAVIQLQNLYWHKCMVTLTNALIMFAFGYVHALYNTSKHMGRKSGLEVVFRNDYWFCLWIYLPGLWIQKLIETMNTKCTCYTAKPIPTVFLLHTAHKIAFSHSKHICDQLAFAVLTSSS